MLACLVAVGVTGCGAIGAAALSGSRERYHDAIRRTGEEQMLLNLVRLQYDDIPFFLQVTSVTSQLTNSLQLSLGPKLSTNSELGGMLSGMIQESPSITYSPLQGETFVNALLRRVRETSLVMLLRSNWRVSTVVKLFVHELGALHNLPVKAPTSLELQQEYDKLKDTLAMLDDLTQRGVVDYDLEPLPMQVLNDMKRRSACEQKSEPDAGGDEKKKSNDPPPAPAGGDKKDDKGKGDEAKPGQDDTWPVVFLRSSLSPADHEEWCEVVTRLRARRAQCKLGPQLGSGWPQDTCGNAYFLISTHLCDTRFQNVDYINITMRTLLEAMMTVSGGVSVPEGRAHRMPTAKCDDSTHNVEAMNELFHVYCSQHKPEDVAIRVHYNGTWYYIKREDSESRQVFSMVLLMFQERLEKEAAPLGPLLTLPVNR